MSKLESAYRVCSKFIDDYSPYKFINRAFFFRCIMNDRWGWLTQFSSIDWKDLNERPLNLSEYPILDMGDLIDKRAIEIVNRAYNSEKEIIVSFSGGVDSCCVVCALLKHRKPNQKISIVYTDKSMEENPTFFDFMVKNNIDMYHSDASCLYDFLEKRNDYLLVTGWCADQLFHFGVINKIPDECFHMDWKDAMPIFLNIQHKCDGNYEMELYADAVEIIDDYVKHVLPTPLTCMCEFAWFWNFTCKYAYIRNVTKLEAKTDYLFNNNIPFFDTPEFNIWSLQNYQNIKVLTPWNKGDKAYKLPLKEYIVSMTNDPLYYSLRKIQSYQDRYKFNQKALYFSIIDEKGLKNKVEVESQQNKYDYLLLNYNKAIR